MIDQDLDAPWKPLGTREFQVGDYVRVRLSGECRIEGRPLFVSDHLPTGQVTHGHDPREDGATGTITEMAQSARKWTHPYLVTFDRVLKIHAGLFDAISYAPSELELVEGR